MEFDELEEIYHKALCNDNKAALNTLKEESKSNNDALVLLGKCYFFGAATMKSVVKGTDAYYKAYKGGNLYSILDFEILCSLGILTEYDIYQIKDRLKKYDDQFSLTMLGLIYLIKKDNIAAVKTLIKANTDTAYDKLYKEFGVKLMEYLSDKEIDSLINSAIKNNCFEGLISLSCLYLELEKYKLSDEALDYIINYSKSDKIIALAYCTLGNLYAKNAIQENCHIKMNEYLEKAYSLGYTRATYLLGKFNFMFGEIHNIPNYKEKAFKYLKLSYDNLIIFYDDDAISILDLLSDCYKLGFGCKKNEEKATDLRHQYKIMIDNFFRRS